MWKIIKVAMFLAKYPMVIIDYLNTFLWLGHGYVPGYKQADEILWNIAAFRWFNNTRIYNVIKSFEKPC